MDHGRITPIYGLPTMRVGRRVVARVLMLSKITVLSERNREVPQLDYRKGNPHCSQA